MANVRVFSTSTCPYCVTLKNFLKEHNIDFLEVDVASDEASQKEMIEKTGQMGVPVIDINGEFIVGFEKEKISQLLGIRN